MLGARATCFRMNILCALRHTEGLTCAVSDRFYTVKRPKITPLEYRLLLVIKAGYINFLFFTKLRFSKLTKTNSFVFLH
jgi:hypothetical protein